MWSQLGPAGENVLKRGAERLPEVAAAPYHPSRRLLLSGGLAAAAAYVIVRPPLQLWPSFSELRADYRTAVGERRNVALADGASIELNTRTSVALRASGGGIELIDGEALIDTGRKLTAPLLLLAGNGQASATEARFNVRHDGARSCVTCLSGTVSVLRAGATQHLGSGQQSIYGGGDAGTVSAADTAATTAWQDGMLVFQQTPLATVVAEVNRYRPGKIVLVNPNLGERTINARFSVQNVDQIMMLAKQVLGAKVTTLPGGFVFLS